MKKPPPPDNNAHLFDEEYFFYFSIGIYLIVMNFIYLYHVSIKTILLLVSILAMASASSCKKDKAIENDPDPEFSNVVILGNSITYSPANAEVGWNGNWGMAASAPEFDFVHLLTADFKEKNKACIVTAKNIAAFEVNYTVYNLAAELKQIKDLKPDLLIIRIGENVQQEGIDSVAFEQKYASLIDYFKADNPDLKVLAAGSFWGNPTVDRIVSRHSAFLTLKTLGLDMSNYAWGQYENIGVASHPSDKGMAAIAALIWSDVLHL